MIEEPLVLEQSGSLAYLVLNAPPRNEMNRFFFESLIRLAEEDLHRLDVKGLVVHARGRHFSSGADIHELMAGVSEEGCGFDRSFLVQSTMSMNGLAGLPFPTVAAIRGCCFGSGLELALACDFRIATPSAVFSLPEMGFGLMPGLGGTVRLPKLAGLGKALELILTGRTFLADEAFELGVVDLIAEKDDLLKKAEELALRMSTMERGVAR